MFTRIKKSGQHQYVQVVHNQRIRGKVRQRVIATLGRRIRRHLRGRLGQASALLGACAPQVSRSTHQPTRACASGAGLQPLGQIVEHIRRFMHPAALLTRGWPDFAQAFQKPKAPSPMANLGSISSPRDFTSNSSSFQY